MRHCVRVRVDKRKLAEWASRDGEDERLDLNERGLFWEAESREGASAGQVKMCLFFLSLRTAPDRQSPVPWWSI